MSFIASHVTDLMWSAVVLGGVLMASAWLLHPLALYYGDDRLAHIPVMSLLRFSFHVRFQALVLWLFRASPNLPSIPDVASMSSHVLRVLGKNPSGMTLTGTNVYLVGSGARRLVIDCSDGNAAFVKTLRQVCERHGVQEISDLLVTHGHYDHAGGLLQLRKTFPLLRVWKYLPVEGREGDGNRRLSLSNKESRRLGIQALVDGQRFDVPGTSNGVLTTVYTPGHCNDHVCFVLDGIEDLEGPVLFSGDCILGFGSCVFDSLADLMASLTKLKGYGAATIYPGHGPMVSDASTKIQEYLTHRQQREDEVLDVLHKHSDRLNGLSSSAIVDQVYEPLPYILRLSATKTVDKHLQKLLGEDRVQQLRPAGWFQTATYRAN